MTARRAAKTCSRCGLDWRFGFAWPEGFVCRSCVTRAVKVRGVCPGCGDKRLLVGRDDATRPICVDCAGITTCFRCATCGEEGQQWYSATCVSCSLARRLTVVLDDGTGQLAPSLVPLFERLCSMANPLSGMTWLNKVAVRQRLGSLADGSTPLTHEGIDSLCGTQGREFLRELLVDSGLLPYRDKYLAAFEAWRVRRLASIDDPAVKREIALYLSWRHSRDLAVRAEAGRLPAEAANVARDRTDAAVRFLGFLSGRGRALDELEQADVDAWFATASNPQAADDFLVFAVAHRRCRKIDIPRGKRRSSPGCSAAHLAELVRRLLDDDGLELSDRVAGLFVVLFAQPVSRVASLRLGDICEVDDGPLSISFGPDPIELPEPVATIVASYLASRSRMNTTNTTTDYLFPGGRPGAHVTAQRLAARLNRLGITKSARQGALSHLLSEVPAAVVARVTGYATDTTAARAALAGSDWARYAALKQAALR